MSCSQCPHCQRGARLAPFTLPPRPVGNGPGAAEHNAAFYAAFAAAYDRARTETAQPGRLLRDANPWLTVHSLRDYYRRVRELGWLAGPGAADGRSATARTARPVAAAVEPAPADPVTVGGPVGDDEPVDDRPAPWCELPGWLELDVARWLAGRRDAERPVKAAEYADVYGQHPDRRGRSFTVQDAADDLSDLAGGGFGRMGLNGFTLADRFRDAPRPPAPRTGDRGRPRRPRRASYDPSMG